MSIYIHLYSALFSIHSAQTWITQFLPANHTTSAFLWSPYVIGHYIFALWFLSSSIFFFLA